MATLPRPILPLAVFFVIGVVVVGLKYHPYRFNSCNCDEDGSDMETLVRFQLGSDFLIALAYFSIPLELLYFISCTEVFPFWWVIAQFGAFIVLCGLTHFVAIWTYAPHSFSVMLTETILKILTALVSCATAISLVHIIPMLLHVKVRELFLQNKAEELNREVNLIKRQEETGRHVRMLTQEIRRSLDKHTILAILLEQLSKTLHLENCSIWMPEGNATMQLTHEFKRRVIQVPVQISADEEIVKVVQNSTGAVPVPPDSALGKESSHAAAVLGPMVAVRLPLLRCSNFESGTPQHMDATYAVMVLGLPKGAGREWGQNELDIVETVADQVAVALSHAAILEESHRIQDLLVDQNKALQQVRQDAVTAISARDEFLAVMNHELRTPLHSVRALASLLQESDLSPEQRAVVDTVTKSSGLLSTIIDDMKDYKFEDGRLELDHRPFDLLALFREAANIAIPISRSKGLKFSLDMPTGVPQFVMGDEKRLLQVTLNMIGNAIRSTRQGSVVIAVRTDTQEGFRWDPRKPMWRPSFRDGFVFLRIEVRDTGTSTRDPKFTKGHMPVSEPLGDCAGAHLSASEKIVQLMKGHMWFEGSGSGRGSVATCVVPVQLVSQSVSVPQNEIICKDDLKGMKVLLADDNLTNRIVTKQVLEKLGCQVTVVESGRQCLATLSQPGSMYKILLLDIWMPEMDGYEVARRIQKNIHPERRPWIVALTADTDEITQERCLKLGMDGVILKPVSMAEMSSKLSAILKRQNKVQYNIIR